MKSLGDVAAYEEAVAHSFRGDEWLERIYIGGLSKWAQLIEEKTQEFLLRGGKIEQIPSGKSSIDYILKDPDDIRKRRRVGQKTMFIKREKGDI